MSCRGGAMRKICPKCRGKFEAQFLCPNCGVQLVEGSTKPSMLSKRRPIDALPPAGMVTRFAAGWLLAQGLYYGVRQFGTALFLILGEPDSLDVMGEVAN